MSTVADPATTAAPVSSPSGGRWRALVGRVTTAEVGAFLGVGAAGYLVDLGAFNGLRVGAPFDGWDPILAKVAAVGLAMVVTYVGNALVTWRGRVSTTPARLVGYVTLNVVGLGFSVICLWLSHDLLGWTSPLADNLSGNVVGLGLGTGFRFWSYRRLVFR